MLTNNYYAMLVGMATNAPIPMKNYAGNDYYACTGSSAAALYNYLSTVVTSTNLTNTNTSPGVFFSENNDAPTKNDYQINPITGLNVTCTRTFETIDGGGKCTAIYTITNTKTTEVTISKVGLYVKTSAKSSPTGTDIYASIPMLMDTTLLDEPVTIPSGAVAQITYTISMTLPSA